MDLTYLGLWKELDGGESASYQSNDWKWDGVMTSLDLPWSICNPNMSWRYWWSVCCHSIYTYLISHFFFSVSVLLLWPFCLLSSLTLLILFQYYVFYRLPCWSCPSDLWLFYLMVLSLGYLLLRSSIYSPCVTTSVLLLYFCFPPLSLLCAVYSYLLSSLSISCWIKIHQQWRYNNVCSLDFFSLLLFLSFCGLNLNAMIQRPRVNYMDNQSEAKLDTIQGREGNVQIIITKDN